MAIEILMPALSPTMTEGNLAKWLKKEGDKVKPGEVIAEIETDKATMEVEAVDAGTIGKLVISSGTIGVKVNQLIAVLLEEGDDKSSIERVLSKFGSNSNHQPKSVEKRIPETKQPLKQEITQSIQIAGGNRVIASPLAKRVAQIEGMNLTEISGSGPHGRIIKADVLNAKSKKQPSASSTALVGRNPQEFTKVALTQVRKIIAKRLVESKQTIPHFYLTIDCELTQLLKLREEINLQAPKINDKPSYKISVNDIVIKAAAIALRDLPKMNSSYLDDSIVYYNNIDISIAVAIDDGLITPIIKNVDQKTLSTISNEMKDLAQRAKANQLKPEEFQGGGFTITNLGMYGVKNFNAIVNPPQSAILAVGAGEERVIVKDSQIKTAYMMSVSLSCDHRVIDGALAAEFMSKFKKLLENPGLMLV